MLRHKRIPCQISLQTLNPLIAPLEDDRVVIDRVDADSVGRIRQAHPVLDNMSFVFGLSAKTLPALEEFCMNYIDWLCSSESVNVRLVDIAYTATALRQIYSCRLAVSACTRTELLEKLESVAVVQVQHPSTPPAQAIFVFSGQGSQCLGMGRRLYDDFLLFHRCIDKCQHILISSGFPHSVLPIIRGTGGLTTWEVFEAYQVAIFALESPEECPTHLVEEDHIPTHKLDVHTSVVNAFLWGEKGVTFSLPAHSPCGHRTTMARSLPQPLLLPHSHIADSVSLSLYHSIVHPLLHSTTILCNLSFTQAQVLCSSGPLSPVMQISTASLCHYPLFSSQSVLVKTLSISSSHRPISAPAPAPPAPPAPAPNPAPAPGVGAAPVPIISEEPDLFAGIIVTPPAPPPVTTATPTPAPGPAPIIVSKPGAKEASPNPTTLTAQNLCLAVWCGGPCYSGHGWP
ncbi:hypothetical protein DFH08DRAFT_1055213 [Mycena albidolilacea]|uniref:Malonyl-CoA:ACP transacylase (MAT) domain-containing protein n=1 Tax=Mycena albidolilacea TaxID=1033008 RepID=A0AAD6Z2D8_9AGAR|nr:hypothetical protein DFH08DRAFT_1055213 [Mycena albidolilacea]